LGFSTSGDCLSGDFSGGIINPETIDPTTKQRSSSATAYLLPVRDRANLTVLTGATVEKVILNKTNEGEIVAEGVQYIKGGVVGKAHARKDVIISAGTLNSPKLLELSGIGNPELLKTHGIDVIVDNPNVGENLQNHLMLGVNFEVGDSAPPTIDGLSRQEPEALAAAMAAYSQGRGPLATGGTYASAQLPLPDIQTEEGKQDLEKLLGDPAFQAPVTTASPTFAKAHEDFVRSVLSSATEPSGCYISFPGFAKFNGDGHMAPTPAGKENYFTIALLLMHPLSRGSVHITSSSASSTDMAFDPRYLSHPLDLEVAARHLRFLVSRLASAAPLADQLRPGQDPVPDLEAARNYIRDTAVGAHHFTSTCSMMPREAGGVVDHNLRVHGVARGLRVCDASVIPITPRANTQAAVYGVAERAAEIIKLQCSV
jgi:choline dehydrogenase-like flavoprotein